MLKLNVNGKAANFAGDPDTPILWVLRDHLDVTSPKFGCGMALCGACTVHLDGAPIRSCSTPVSAAAGKKITTVEGLPAKLGKALQDAWIAEEVPQCGYCQTGQMMTAAALINTNKNPSNEQIVAAMDGNICRCGTYSRIQKAVTRAAKASA
ncbi:MAG: (2Fe-2S)-binding protein [Burkholderiales bacterium]|nr:MAG: (2Fe-2S)-binding protein [Betaproteobacteria bacterium]TAG24079.1 MAG: (2Fe-2S)-binding protein [Burkholderiales bacterium]